MKRALLGSALLGAASVALAGPASGETFVTGSFSGSAALGTNQFVSPAYEGGVRIHRGFDRRSGRRFPVRRDRVDRDYGYPYAGGYYDEGDYDANRSFDPDKWNDWWHERPERSFPRWVWRNHDCSEDRMWYSGAGWRCTP